MEYFFFLMVLVLYLDYIKGKFRVFISCKDSIESRYLRVLNVRGIFILFVNREIISCFK